MAWETLNFRHSQSRFKTVTSKILEARRDPHSLLMAQYPRLAPMYINTCEYCAAVRSFAHQLGDCVPSTVPGPWHVKTSSLSQRTAQPSQRGVLLAAAGCVQSLGNREEETSQTASQVSRAKAASLLKKVLSELSPGSKLYYQRPLQPTLGSLPRQETHYPPRPGVATQLGSHNGVSNRKHPFSPESL